MGCDGGSAGPRMALTEQSVCATACAKGATVTPGTGLAGEPPLFLCSSAWFWSHSAALQQEPPRAVGNHCINRVAPSGNVCLAPLRHSKSHGCFYGRCCSNQQPLLRRILHLRVLYRSQNLHCPTRSCLSLSLEHRRAKVNPNQLHL